MKISVVMPAYQAERYIGSAIDSVLAQSHRDFELLVIDDGSKDGTREIALERAARDDRVRVRSRENRGAAASTQEGLEMASSEFVAIMHADDLMLPQRLERQLVFMLENPDVAAASSYVWYIGPDGRRIGSYRSTATDREAVRQRWERDGVVAVHHPATMLRRSDVLAAGGYRSGFRVTEDIDLWSRLWDAGKYVLVQPEYLLEYRIHGTSASVASQRHMARETRWVIACRQARLDGKVEPSFEQFLADEKGRGPLPRLLTSLQEEATVQYKAAVHDFANRRLLSTFWRVMYSTALWPTYAPRQVLRKLG